MPAPKNRPQLSSDARHRMGVYKRIDTVPDRYQLLNHEAAYAGRDTWTEYFTEKTEQFNTKPRGIAMKRRAAILRLSWKT